MGPAGPTSQQQQRPISRAQRGPQHSTMQRPCLGHSGWPGGPHAAATAGWGNRRPGQPIGRRHMAPRRARARIRAGEGARARARRSNCLEGQVVAQGWCGGGQAWSSTGSLAQERLGRGFGAVQLPRSPVFSPKYRNSDCVIGSAPV